MFIGYGLFFDECLAAEFGVTNHTWWQTHGNGGRRQNFGNIGDTISSSCNLHAEAFLGKIPNSKFPSINKSEFQRACEF